MTTATKITVSRICLVPIFVICITVSFSYHLLVSAILYAIISITDILDGYIARKTNTVSNLGKILDPLADKVLSITGMMFCVGFKLFYVNGAFAVLVSIVVFRELLLSTIRLLAKHCGKVLASDIFGKIKTIFINTAIPTVLVSGAFSQYANFYRIVKTVGTSIFFVGVVLAIFSGIRFIVINKSIIQEVAVQLRTAERKQVKSGEADNEDTHDSETQSEEETHMNSEKQSEEDKTEKEA